MVWRYEVSDVRPKCATRAEPLDTLDILAECYVGDSGERICVDCEYSFVAELEA